MHYPEPLDHALAARLLRVEHSPGGPVPGAGIVSADGRTWSFTPARPWPAGRYELLAGGELEDLAGNSLYRAFETVAGQKIKDLVTVNGVRVMLEDGTWGLVRASSNKPELVIVVESPVSEANMRAIFADIDGRLSKFPEVGEYNQKI